MRGREVLAVPLRALRRAGIVWALSIGSLVVMTVAFWPAFRGETALDDVLKTLPPALIDAFGLADFGTPAGFLRGNLYAVLVPLMLAVAGVMLANGQLSAEEDAGRLELYLAQPVTRTAIFLGRAGAVLIWLAVIGAGIFAVQVVADAAFDLSIATDRVVATIVLCGLLGALHAGLVAFVAGITARPALALGIGMGVAVAGYVVMALFPISEVLAPYRHISPWDWALGSDPLVHGADLWRYVVLAVPTLLLIAAGSLAFNRRDISSA
ncbi:MAG TPA: ABC transporter permease subunit [Candidatus Limnocylindria bacterium]|nr:ABC transporter permease subunit [Candidatus Limnocylindria bacterium]